MKKLLLTSLTFALTTQQIHAMENFMHIPLTMETDTEIVRPKKATKSDKNSCAQDCACAAKVCCFACALCGLVTAPAMAAPVHAKPRWERIDGDSLNVLVTVKQKIYANNVYSTEITELELPCFWDTRNKQRHCTYSLIEAFKFYEDNWPTQDGADSHKVKQD